MEEHDDDVGFQTGSGNTCMAVSSTRNEKQTIGL